MLNFKGFWVNYKKKGIRQEKNRLILETNNIGTNCDDITVTNTIDTQTVTANNTVNYGIP